MWSTSGTRTASTTSWKNNNNNGSRPRAQAPGPGPAVPVFIRRSAQCCSAMAAWYRALRGQHRCDLDQVRLRYGWYFPAATGQRPDPRVGLRPDRHRLHNGLWHHRHDQLRARRGVYDFRLPGGDQPGIAGLFRRRILPPADVGHLVVHHCGDRGIRLHHRAHRLQTLAQLHPPGAAHQRHRHFPDPAELRADQPRCAATGGTYPA